jgi:hypothetical protein
MKEMPSMTAPYRNRTLAAQDTHTELLSSAHEHGALVRRLAQVQRRCSALIAEQAQRIERQEAELMRLRGELIRQCSRAWLTQTYAAEKLPQADALVCLTGCLSQGGHWLDEHYCRRKAQPCNRLIGFAAFAAVPDVPAGV